VCKTQRNWRQQTVDEINPQTQEKYPGPINILKSLKRSCIDVLRHQMLLHIIVFKVSIRITDWAFTKPSTVRPFFLPYHAQPTSYSFTQ